MIYPICDICGKDLKEFGAICFSPPNKKGYCKKYHICILCFNNVEKLFKRYRRVAQFG